MRELTALRAMFRHCSEPEPAADSGCDLSPEVVGEFGLVAIKRGKGRHGCGRERVEYSVEEDKVVMKCPYAQQRRMHYSVWLDI